MKKKIRTIVIGIIFFIGLSLLLYPLAANTWNNHRQEQLMSEYEKVVSQKEAAGEIDYEAEIRKAEAYNAALLPSILPDSFAVAEASEVSDENYLSCMDISGDGMLGIIEIPKINVKLPMYHTTDKEVLQKAAGHLEGSSLPIGGKNTHSVLSAHRGLPSASLFTDLDKLEEGDHFLLHVLDETLSYEVDQILIVEPEETEALAVQNGKDLVTLLTCTPYGVNSQRLLLRGHRVPYNQEEIADEQTPLGAFSLHTNYVLWVVVGISVTAFFILLLYLMERRKKQRAAKLETLPETNKKEQ